MIDTSNFNLVAIFNIFGNGDLQKGRAMIIEIAEKIKELRQEDNIDFDTPLKAYVMLDDLGAKWYRDEISGAPASQYNDLIALMATCVRVANREFEN